MAITHFEKKTGFNYLKMWKDQNRGSCKGDIEGFVIEDTLWVCNNSRIETDSILITGINPSFNGYKSVHNVTFAETSNTNESDYWQTKKAMVCCHEKVAYMDLFPIAMTRQKDFMDDKIVPKDLKAALLRITRDEIERLHPSIIINPNLGSAVYWGFNKRHPWMGYDLSMEPKNPIGKQTRLYRINGVQQHEDVICSNSTHLSGTRFLLAKYHGNGALKKEDFLLSEDIKKIR